jgi:CBS domain containing-hemolysin-like protein
MSDQFPVKWTPPTERNPKTAAKFKSESWWQITFPMLVVTLLMGGCLVGLLFWSGEVGVSIVADYSMILLGLPMLIVGIALAAVVIALIVLVGQGIDKIPPYTYVAQKFVFKIQHHVTNVAQTITNVIISIRSFLDGILGFLTDRLQPKPAAPETTPPSKSSKSGIGKR